MQCVSACVRALRLSWPKAAFCWSRFSAAGKTKFAQVTWLLLNFAVGANATIDRRNR
jgi:hypothetical protein